MKQYSVKFQNELGNYSRKNGSYINKSYSNNTLLFINSVFQIIIIDIVFIIFNKYINNYKLFSLNQIFTLVINFALTHLSLNILKNFDASSSEFALDIEKKIKFKILDNGDSNFNSLKVESQCLDLFYLIRNGIVSLVHLLLYPIRFGILGYIFFNNNWKASLFMSKVICLLFFTAVFEFLRIRLLIIPKQKSILIQISDYLDNLKTLLLLGTHRENYINSPKTTVFINFFKNILNYVLMTLHAICIMYFISMVLHYFNENLNNIELSRMYIFNYWLAIYLLYSTKYINSCIFLTINYGYLDRLFSTSKNITFNDDFSSIITGEYNYINNEIPDKNPVSEPLTITKNSTEFEITEEYDIIHEKFPLINNIYENSIKKYRINYSTSGKLFDTDVKTDYFNSNTIQNYDDISNYKKLKHAQFNSGNIFYKNLSLSISYEKKRGKHIKKSSNCFNYFGLFEKKKVRQAYSNGFNDDQLDKVISNELMESKYCLKNVNLYIKMNENIVIFGSDDISKELLTKFISGFPGTHIDKQIDSNSPGFINCDVYLFNRNMLELVSDLYEFQKSEFTLDPFDFVLSGSSFNKDIFELIYNSFLYDYFAKNDSFQESNGANSYYIYPKVESNQEFVEAKICLQLSQFFYHILISIDRCSSVIVIIDGILELLLPNTYIKLAKKLLSSNSIFSEFNISFVITTESDLFPYLSNLYNNNPYVKLAILNENGLKITNNSHLNEEINKNFIEDLPPIDDAMNNIFVNSKSDNAFSSKSLYHISELYFKKIGSGNLYTKKFLFFAYIIGLVSFIMKLMIFSNSYLNKIPNDFGSVYDYFIFEILSFGPLISSISISGFHSNDISGMIVGYIAISSFFIGNYNTPLSEIQLLINKKDQFNDKTTQSYKDLPKILGTIPEENDKSSSFIQFDGKQTLKTTSLFYKEHFYNSQIIHIPGVKSIGFKNAMVLSKLIQDRLNVSKKSESEIPIKNKTLVEKKRELKSIFSREAILIIIWFVAINIISKIFIYISIFGLSFINNYLTYSDYFFNEFVFTILSSDDPISVMNDIKLRRNRYLSYLFEEIYNRKSKIATHYLTIIHGLSLLFFFAISKNAYSNFGLGILINTNLLIITFLFPILYNIVKLFNFNKEKIKHSGMNYNSLDILYYLRKSNSLTWFKDQTNKFFKIKLENSNKLIHLKFNLLLNSLIISLACSILYLLVNYIRGVNNKQLMMDLTIFLPIIFFLVNSIHSHIMKTSKANNVPSINPHGYIKWLKGLFYKTIYFPMYINISSYSGSPRTNTSFSPDIEESIPTEDGYELSTPISKDSHNIDPILSIHSIPIKLNSDISFKLINPLLLLDDSLTFGSTSSPLFPIKRSRTLNINNINRTAVVSNYNLVSSSWPINMVLDPNGIYMNDYESLLHILQSLNIFPEILRNFNPTLILSLSVREYSDLINNIANNNSIISGMSFANDGLEFKELEPKILAEDNYNVNQNISIIHVKKLLLFGHFVLYSMHYRELILHLDYNMDLNFWIYLVKKFFEGKKSSIKSIIIISSDHLN